MLTTAEKEQVIRNLNVYRKGISTSAWFSNDEGSPGPPGLEGEKEFRSPSEASHEEAMEYG